MDAIELFIKCLEEGGKAADVAINWLVEKIEQDEDDEAFWDDLREDAIFAEQNLLPWSAVERIATALALAEREEEASGFVQDNLNSSLTWHLLTDDDALPRGPNAIPKKSSVTDIQFYEPELQMEGKRLKITCEAEIELDGEEGIPVEITFKIKNDELQCTDVERLDTAKKR